MGWRSSLVLWWGFCAAYLVVQDRGGDGWEAPLWKVMRPQYGHDGADTRPHHQDEVTRLSEEHSLRLMAAAGHISFDPSSGRSPPLIADSPDEDERQRALWQMRRGMELYPAGFLQQIGLRGVAFGKNLKHDHWRLGGSSYPGGYIVLDVENRDPRWVLHHELFHTIEHESHLAFQGWESLNPEGFRYDEEGWVKSPEESPCFVSAYATSTPHDDRAEIFAALMTRRPLRDECVRAKAHAVALAMARLSVKLPEAITEHLTAPEPAPFTPLPTPFTPSGR